MSTKELGNLAENIAARYLQEKGYEIIEKNYEMPWGEVDIIAKVGHEMQYGYENNGGEIVFVEVKANRADLGPEFNPEERVNPHKLRKIARTAQFCINKEFGGIDVGWRIDVISITFDAKNKKAKLKHFKNI